LRPHAVHRAQRRSLSLAFAGIWCRWHGTRGTKKNPVDGEHTLLGFAA